MLTGLLPAFPNIEVPWLGFLLRVSSNFSQAGLCCIFDHFNNDRLLKLRPDEFRIVSIIENIVITNTVENVGNKMQSSSF